jgi:transcriptional regulator GlxA family with amidase domain
MELLEANGIRNYKTFGKMFREMYGYSPREVRKMR